MLLAEAELAIEFEMLVMDEEKIDELLELSAEEEEEEEDWIWGSARS